MPRPTVAAQNNREMANAMSAIGKAMDAQTQMMGQLVNLVLERVGASPAATQSMRTVDAKDAPKVHDGFAEVAGRAPTGTQAVAVFKSRSRGLVQVIKQSYKIQRGPDGDYEMVPPKVAEFVDGTWRADNAEDAELLRAKLERKRRKNSIVDIIECKDEIAELLSKPGTEVKGVKPDKMPDTSPEQEPGKRVEVAEAVVA